MSSDEVDQAGKFAATDLLPFERMQDMSGDDRPTQHSVDIAIAALEKGRRAGWARAYALEAELAQAREELAQVREELHRMTVRAEDGDRIGPYSSAVLKVIAPSLVPWLNGGDPGVATFGWGNGPAVHFGRDGEHPEYFLACGSDGHQELTAAGQRDAESWLQLDDETRRQQDWRAAQMFSWYDDPSADIPRCGRCNCESWRHRGPDAPCTTCECAAYR